ncbi:hypothetical protein HYX04_04055 [Candidatus Woesearchaeota archaeon]|nr:hypothetical protein [Candidatus Woesearchaeota archaeon]
MAVLIISLPIIFAEEYSRSYDANGNLIYDSQTDIYREYNELNQLIRTRQNNSTGTILQEYTWEPIKERIFIKDEFYTNGSLKSSTYYFDDDYIVLQNSSGTYNRTNIYQDGILVGYEDFDGRKRYILPDHEGSVHIVLNESGDVIEENLFSPFAEPLQDVLENKFSYEAKEYDSLTKDYNFNFRMFSPNGPPIFNQPDSLIPNVYDPQSLNRYSFERNNPLKNTDPTGHITGTEWIIGIGIAATAVDLATVVSYNTLININENPTLENELVQARENAWKEFFGGFGVDEFLNRIFGRLYGTVGNVALTASGVQTYNDYAKKVALANPFKYKEYIDSIAANRQFNSDAERISFYTVGGVNLISLTESLTLYSTYGSGSNIKESMQNTAMSGKDIKWYYNENTGTYTWRVGDTAPSGTGWKSSGSSSGGSSGRSSSPGKVTQCKLNCAAIKKLRG